MFIATCPKPAGKSNGVNFVLPMKQLLRFIAFCPKPAGKDSEVREQ